MPQKGICKGKFCNRDSKTKRQLHHGPRDELKDSAGWLCLDSRGGCGISAAALLTAFSGARCSGSMDRYCLLVDSMCPKMTS